MINRTQKYSTLAAFGAWVLVGSVLLLVEEPGWSQTFNPAVTIQTATHPNQMIAADLNSDGYSDLSISHYSDSGSFIRVLLSTGSGFASPVDYSIPNAPGDRPVTPQYMVAADLNADGRPDLAYTGFYSSGATYQRLGILLNSGSGFTSGSTYSTGDDAAGITAADLDGNGRMDLAVASRPSQSSSSGNASVHYQQSDGTFALQTYSVGDATYGIKAADFNRDGHPDLAVLTDDYYYPGQPIRILYGQAGGLNSTVVRADGPYNVLAMSVDDYDGDDLPDIAMGGSVSDHVLTILHGQDSGSFAREDLTSPHRPYSIEGADFDGDGRPDMAMSFTSSGLRILFGQDDGTLGNAEDLSLDSKWGELAVGDFNGDGGYDLAVLNTIDSQNHTINSISVLYNTTPEPATLLLLGFGAMGILSRRRARRAK